MPKIKVKGQTIQAGEHRQTDRQTNGQTDATKRIISPASRSIIKVKWFKHESENRQTDEHIYQTHYLPATWSIKIMKNVARRVQCKRHPHLYGKL